MVYLTIHLLMDICIVSSFFPLLEKICNLQIHILSENKRVKEFLQGQGILVHLPTHLSIHQPTHPSNHSLIHYSAALLPSLPSLPLSLCLSFLRPFLLFFNKSSISRHIISGSKARYLLKIGTKPAAAFGKAFRVLKHIHT